MTPKLAHVVFPCKSLLRVHSTGQTLVRTWTACAWVAPWAYGFRSPFASTAYNSIAVTPKLAYVVFPLEKCSICVSIKCTGTHGNRCKRRTKPISPGCHPRASAIEVLAIVWPVECTRIWLLHGNTTCVRLQAPNNSNI